MSAATTPFDEAVLRHRAGDLALAEDLYVQALAADPEDVRAATNLGVLLMRTNRATDALPLLTFAVQRDGSRLQNWLFYIEALADAGQRQSAEQVVERLRGLGVAAETLAPLQARLAAGAESPAAAAAGGLALSRAGRDVEAEAAYRQALAQAPDDGPTWANLGATLIRLGRDDEAEAALRRALDLEPGNGPAHLNLGALLRDGGRLDEARTAFGAAADGDDRLSPHLQARLALSPVPASEADITEQRDAYARGLDELQAHPGGFRHEGGPLHLPWYYLAYHGRDDRELIGRTAEVLAEKVEGLAYVSPAVSRWRGPPGRRIRVAFVSSLFRDHSVGRLYENFVRRLDRTEFETIVVHGVESARDGLSAGLDAAADGVVTLEGDLARQRAAIEAIAPDILFYPDVGMTADTYLLAHARLAPVQAVTGGHPDTTGIATLDYFVSGDALEPPEGENHYVERLIRLDRIPGCIEASAPVAEPPSREALGLPAKGRLYGCPHTLFKFHPQFDAVLDAIASGDPDGWIVMPSADRLAWTARLKARWREQYPALSQRAVWLPRAPREAFLAQLSHYDLVLDPLHFGCGHTIYLALAQGAPLLTCPGEFARSRTVLAVYRQIGAGEAFIAEGPEDYARRAVSLAQGDARARLGGELREAAKDELFLDLRAVRSLEAFFRAAVAAAAAGERLVAGWRPEPSELQNARRENTAAGRRTAPPGLR